MKACAGERGLRCVCCRVMFFSTKENREENLISGCRIKMILFIFHATLLVGLIVSYTRG